MGRLTRFGGACLALLVCLPAPGLASGGASDAAATRAYLNASLTYARVVHGKVRASVAAIEDRANQIANGCPGALTYAPRDEAFGKFAEMIDATVFYAGAVPVRLAMLRFSRAIGRLEWNDRSLTKVVHALASEEGMIATLALPNVCADIEAWRASAYSALPAAATLVLARLEWIESLSSGAGRSGSQERSLEEAVAHDLGRYEGPADRRLVERIERLESQTDKQTRPAVRAAEKKVETALGVSVP